MYVRITIDQKEVVDVMTDCTTSDIVKGGLVEIAKVALDKWFTKYLKETKESKVSA